MLIFQAPIPCIHLAIFTHEFVCLNLVYALLRRVVRDHKLSTTQVKFRGAY